MLFWLSNLRRRGLALRMAALWAVTLVVLGLAIPVAFRLGGWPSVAAASLAGTACLLGASLGLVASRLMPARELAFVAMLAGTLLRMGIPLGAGLLIHLQCRPLAEAGILYYLVFFYPVTLILGTALSLPHDESSTTPPCRVSDTAP
jgi:hypothetical protein